MIVLVIGMHRSGTSLISRSMRVFGINHGNQLLARADNAKGHWEDLDLLHMNDSLLRYVGKTWSTMSMICSEEIDRLLASDLRAQAVRLIDSKVKVCSCYGFKDPRTTLLLPFWQQVLVDCGLTPVYLFVVRRPRAVVESLSKRNNFEPVRSAYLWINYNLSALRFLLQYCPPSARIDYDDLLAFPEVRLRAVANQLRLPVNEEELRIFANDFLDHSLNHSAASSYDLKLANQDLPTLAYEIYDFLSQSLDSSNYLETPKSKLFLQESWQYLENLQPLLRLADLDFERSQAAEMVASTAKVECSQVRHELSAIYESTSWRLTKPLRELKDLLQPILNSFG